MKFRGSLALLGGIVLLPAACSGTNHSEEETVSTQSASLQSQQAGATCVARLAPPAPPDGGFAGAVAERGHVLFDNIDALVGSDADGGPRGHNGRSCNTCHVEGTSFALLPSDVQTRLAANPSDPLFNPIDADDPTAATPTYDHLLKGLVRITLTLPDNMDLIGTDCQIGQDCPVITPPDRKFSVWRGVPTVQNTSNTAPYQYDGRFATYQIQAQGAITSHSQGPEVPCDRLNLLAAFQSTLYSSDRALSVAEQIARGVPRDKLVNPEDGDTSNGNAVYVKACKGCHGGATDNDITNLNLVNKGLNIFSTVPGGAGPVVLKHDGNVLFQMESEGDAASIIVSKSNPQPNDHFMNLGFAGISEMEQTGFFLPIGPDPKNPHLLFNQSVSLPEYRFRFYTDGTRTKQVTDLPPIPASTGFPCNGPLCGPLNPPFDSNGLPIVGPNMFMQSFSTDPGRAGITGKPADFEAFDIPQLRGVANTAPYFHDNSHATLADVVDTYSRFVIPFIPAIGLPAVYPPECPTNPPTCGLPPEALSPQDKVDLLAFLQTF